MTETLLMLLRKKSVNVLKHLTKLTAALDKIAELEASDILRKMDRLNSIQNEINEHKKESTLALKVSDNIKKLLEIN